MTLLKLDFCKAYDTVLSDFLFAAIEQMGMPGQFIQMVHLLFQDVELAIVINGKLSTTFLVQRGVHQGCPLVPYLFLLFAKTLNVAAKVAMATGTLQGIQLPNYDSHQLLLQFADDTTFTLEGDEFYLRNLVQLLCFFA